MSKKSGNKNQLGGGRFSSPVPVLPSLSKTNTSLSQTNSFLKKVRAGKTVNELSQVTPTLGAKQHIERRKSIMSTKSVGNSS